MVNPEFLLIPRPSDPLEAAIRYFGTAASLARAIGVTTQAIGNWRRRGFVPRASALEIELATDGQCPADGFKAMVPNVEPPRPPKEHIPPTETVNSAPSHRAVRDPRTGKMRLVPVE